MRACVDSKLLLQRLTIKRPRASQLLDAVFCLQQGGANLPRQQRVFCKKHLSSRQIEAANETSILSAAFRCGAAELKLLVQRVRTKGGQRGDQLDFAIV